MTIADLHRAIRDAISNIVDRIANLETRERAEVSGAVPKYTVATLPTPGQMGRTAFATNGRKIGEGVGAGTGVPCYDDSVAWRRYSDDTTVAA